MVHGRRVEKILLDQAKHFGINLLDVANSGNHLHLVLKTKSRRLLSGFLRAVSGLLMRLVMGVERGRPWSSVVKRFWDSRPFSRIVSGRKDYFGLRDYLMLNRVETLGISRGAAREMLVEIKYLKKVHSHELITIGPDGAIT